MCIILSLFCMVMWKEEVFLFLLHLTREVICILLLNESGNLVSHFLICLSGWTSQSRGKEQRASFTSNRKEAFRFLSRFSRSCRSNTNHESVTGQKSRHHSKRSSKLYCNYLWSTICIAYEQTDKVYSLMWTCVRSSIHWRLCEMQFCLSLSSAASS